ncbi:non-homologous end joining protein Ku [Halomonas sp. WWR20]
MPERRDHKGREEARVSGPRPFWSGTIAFGLVSLPVGLFPANRSKPVSLRMIDSDGTPLARRYFCEKEERVLDNRELVRGYEVDKNEFVLVEDKELESLAPEKSQEIDLRRFVPLDEIDPMYFERAYFLTPDKGATKAYRLLARSMEQSRRAGIATFVMRGKEYLVAIIAENGLLRAETLRFFDELRSPADAGLPEAPAKPRAAQVKRFEKAINTMSESSLDRAELNDQHSEQIIERARKKLESGEDVIEAPEAEADPDEGGEVVDLMAVLKQSLAQGEIDTHPPARNAAGNTPSSRKRQAAQGRGSQSTPGTAKPGDTQEGSSHKASAKKANAKKGSAKRENTKKAKPARDLASLSKSELYEQAQALDIGGRSQMSKEQLIDAIGDVG